jgi:RNA polymerase sigma factor (sigma-70 family)
MSPQTDPNVLNLLVGNHRRFLEFLERRTGNRADAEDVLQAAFVRAVERGSELREAESAVAWFYRLLRNSLVDRQRSRSAGERALAGRAELQAAQEEGEDEALRAEVCRCVIDLVPTLRPEHAELLKRVDLGGQPVRLAAEALGITPNNAGVRLHRARQALFEQVRRSCGTCAAHGCQDCSCGGPAGCREDSP